MNNREHGTGNREQGTGNREQAGAVTVAAMNAEAVFADLVDIVLDAAKEAPVDRTARDAFYRTVLGDVAHAVSSVVPAEKLSEPVFFTPPLAAQFAKGERRGLEAAAPVVGERRGLEAAAPVAGGGEVAKTSGKGSVNGFEMRVSKTPETVVFMATLPTGRKLSAELTSCGEAYLYDGKEVVCFVKFEGQYACFNWSYGIIRRAMNGLLSKAGRAARHYLNKKALRAGILTPEQELAETVQRQKEEA